MIRSRRAHRSQESHFSSGQISALSLLSFVLVGTGCGVTTADAGSHDAGVADARAQDASVADGGVNVDAGGDGARGLIIAPMVPAGSDSPQLFRMKPDGSGLTQLTKPTGVGMPTDANDFPVLSRDGKSIFFASGREKTPSKGDGGSGDPDPMYRMVFVMDADGGNVHRLTKNASLHCNEYPDDVSPDGAWIVFDMSCDNVGDLSGVEKLYRIHPDGTGQEALPSNDLRATSKDYNLSFGVFTSDGKTMVFEVGDSTSTELWKVDLQTMKTMQLTKTHDAGYMAHARKPMIAPGDGVVYFSSLKTDLSSVRMEKINLDGTGSAVLFDIPLDPTSLGATYDYFALSPAGDAFVFASGVGTQTIAISGLDGKNPKPLPASSEFVGWGGLSWR